MKTVSREQVATSEQVGELALPQRVQEALGQLVGSAREGLLALSVGVGLGVLAELLEEEVVEVVGAKGKHDPARVAVRHGHESGEVTLGGRRVQVERPRVRSADGRSELPLEAYAHFADRDPLTKIVLERMLAGVSTRRYRRTQEPVGSQVEQMGRSTSKSSVSRTFVQRTRRFRRADESPPRRRQAGGDDDRRARAAGTHERRRARDHDRGRQDPARALGRQHRERDRGDRAALGSGRARA
jgi:hypothetical protein